ncbi:MAG: histidine kinase [Desulfovibrionaceae bacterium]|nr:histidine kinase [Desulfovibrionaceae bacterium]
MNKQRRFPAVLRRRLIFYAALSLFVMVCCSTALVTLTLLQSWKEVQESSLLYSAELKAQTATEWMRKNRHLARQAAARTGMRQELEALNKGTKSATEVVPFITGAIQDSLKSSSDMIGITRLNNKGEIIASGGVDIPQHLLMAATPQEDRVRFTPPVALGDQNVILLSTAIHNRQSEFIGTDVIAVAVASLYTLLHKATLVGMWQQGQELWFWPPEASTLPQQDDKKAAQSANPVFDAQLWKACLFKATQGEKGVISTNSLVLAYVPVPDTPWGLVLVEDAHALYAPAWKNMASVGMSIAFIYLLCLGGIVILSRPLAGKILLHTHELEATIAAKTSQLQKTQVELEQRVEERTRSLIETNEALRREQTHRQEVAREIFNLLEQVRGDISRDLHDHTGQLLTTLRLSLENIRASLGTQAQQQSKQIQEAGNTVMIIQRALKDIARGLRPPCLDYLGIIPSLETLLGEYRNAGLKIYFFHKNIPAAIDNELALAFYRIAQEALTNILRHAAASTVHISFTLQQNAFTLSIEDNGKGFDPKQLCGEKLAQHWGITLMHERMVLLDGEFILESSPDKGTQIIARVPCKNQDHE